MIRLIRFLFNFLVNRINFKFMFLYFESELIVLLLKLINDLIRVMDFNIIFRLNLTYFSLSLFIH